MGQNEKGLEVKSEASLTTNIKISPKQEVAFAAECADALMEVISKKPRKVVINGKQYLEFEDWQTIARFYQCTVGIDWVKPLTSENINGKKVFGGYEARAQVLNKDGLAISAAEANCTISEPKWKTRDRFQIKSMAQTRACAKALRNVFSWVVVMKGFAPTPVEEMDEYYNPTPAYTSPEPKEDFIEGLENDQKNGQDVIEAEPEKSKARERMEQGLNGSAFKHTCPVCSKPHNGQYPKCLECYKASKK